jgi:OmpA-OmpF porin, OOP family
MKARSLAVAALASAGCFFSAQALAQLYVGFSVGQTNFGDDIDETLVDVGTVDSSDNGFKAFGGYRFNKYVAAELEYFKLGEATYSGTFGGATVTGGKLRLSGYNLSAVGILPLSERFSGFAKLGIFLWEAKASETTGGVPTEAKEDGNDLSFGLGASYDFTNNLAARLEWQRLVVDSSEVDYLSVGVVLAF